MTEAAKLRKGDRVQLTGTVIADQPSGKMLLFDCARNGDLTYVSTSALAKATVLPRELKVGDWVRTGTMPAKHRIEIIIHGRAALSFGGQLLAHTYWLSELTLDPDHKDDGE